MPDYKALYFELFRASEQAIRLLQDAQVKAEEKVIAEDKPPLELAQHKPSPLGEGGALAPDEGKQQSDAAL